MIENYNTKRIYITYINISEHTSLINIASFFFISRKFKRNQYRTYNVVCNLCGDIESNI